MPSSSCTSPPTPPRVTRRSSRPPRRGGAGARPVTAEVLGGDGRHRHPAGICSPSAVSLDVPLDRRDRPRPRLVAVPGRRSATRATPAPSSGPPTPPAPTPWSSPAPRSTSTTPSACGRRPAACSTCRSSPGPLAETPWRHCAPPGCSVYAADGAGERDLDDVGRRPGGLALPDGVGLRQRGVGPARRAARRWPTTWSGCRSTARREPQPRHGRRGLPVRLGPRPAREGGLRAASLARLTDVEDARESRPDGASGRAARRRRRRGRGGAGRPGQPCRAADPARTDGHDLLGKSLADALPCSRTSTGGSGGTASVPTTGWPPAPGTPSATCCSRRGHEVLVTARFVRAVPTRARRSGVVVGLRDTRARAREETSRAELVSTVAHELRSPLTSVKGFTATLLAKWERFTDEQKRLMLETVNADADRVTRLITELLDIARIDSGRLEIHRQVVDAARPSHRHVAGYLANGEPAERFVVHGARPSAGAVGRRRQGRPGAGQPRRERRAPRRRHGHRGRRSAALDADRRHVVTVMDEGPGIPDSPARAGLHPVLALGQAWRHRAGALHRARSRRGARRVDRDRALARRRGKVPVRAACRHAGVLVRLVDSRCRRPHLPEQTHVRTNARPRSRRDRVRFGRDNRRVGRGRPRRRLEGDRRRGRPRRAQAGRASSTPATARRWPWPTARSARCPRRPGPRPAGGSAPRAAP